MISFGVLVTVKEPAKASARSSRPLRRTGVLVGYHKKCFWPPKYLLELRKKSVIRISNLMMHLENNDI